MSTVFKAALMAAFMALSVPLSSQAMEEPGRITLSIVGGLDRVSQYTRYEEPFWQHRLRELTRDLVQAEIKPFDRAGLKAEEMLPLMRIGAVPFGTALLAIVGSEEAELNALDLPALSPDIQTLHTMVGQYRPHLQRLLKERYNIELLGVYTYPAQVLWCNSPFTGLHDLRGRRIRTSSLAQTEMVEALGAKSVVIPFAQIKPAMGSRVVECAITGTLSGNSVGLPQVSSHVHSMAITWGVSIFGANAQAWDKIPSNLRDQIQGGIAQLERDIWRSAEEETRAGLDCNAGRPSCTLGKPANMTIVPVSEEDTRLRRELLANTVLPRWVERCGAKCADAWNTYLAPSLGITVQRP